MAPLRIEFEWDEHKAESNFRKHGVTFGAATQVFLDPDRVEKPDRSVGYEDRWKTLGLTRGAVLLLVVHTTQESGIEIVRIISARYASKSEEREYYGNR